MTLAEFIKKYDGQGIDYDGAFGFQCMDLYRQYVKEVLGFPQSPPVGGAKDVWDTYLKDNYERVLNTPIGVPRAGDIVIWGTGIGSFGHIAIFVEGNTTKFNSFDQNFPVGTKCHIQDHTYKAVLGWLVPKNPVNEPPANQDEVNQLKEQIKSNNEIIASKALEVSNLTEKNQQLTNKVTEAEEAVNQIRGQRDQAIWDLAQADVKTKTLEEEIVRLDKEIETFKSNNDILAYSWIDRLLSLFGKH